MMQWRKALLFQNELIGHVSFIDCNLQGKYSGISAVNVSYSPGNRVGRGYIELAILCSYNKLLYVT